MARKKMQQSLQYIQQSIFENQSAPIQQSFPLKNPKEKLDVDKKSMASEGSHKVKMEEQVEIIHELKTNTFCHNNQIVNESKENLVEESVEPMVMKFILEGILTSGDKAE